MAFNAAALRAVELTSYSTLDLVDLLRTTDRAVDINAVVRVLSARESRAYKAEAQLEAALADAVSKVQALEDLRQASLAEAEDSARRRRLAEEEARAVFKAAVSEIQEAGKKKQDEVSAHLDAVLDQIHALHKKQREDLAASMAMIVDETEARLASIAKIHEAGKKKQDEVSAHLDAVLDQIHALRKRQREDLSARMAMIVDETEAKLKASFAKIHAPTKKPERDTVPGQEMARALSPLASPSTEIAQESNIIHAPPTTKKPERDALHGKGVAPDAQSKYRVLKMAMVNKRGRAAAEGSDGKSLKRKADGVELRSASPVQISVALKETMINEEAGPCSDISPSMTVQEPNPLEETGEGGEATQHGKGTAEEPVHLEDASIINVPVQQVDRFVRATASKRGRGRGPTVPKENKEKSKNVSRGSPSLGTGRGGRSNTSANPLLGASSLKRPSPVCATRPGTVPKFPRTETASQSGNAIPEIQGLARPSSCPLGIKNISGAQIRDILGVGSQGTENWKKYVENKTDSVPVTNSVAKETSDEDGDVSTSGNDTGGASNQA